MPLLVYASIAFYRNVVVVAAPATQRCLCLDMDIATSSDLQLATCINGIFNLSPTRCSCSSCA